MVGKDFIYMGKRLSDFNFIMVKPKEDDTLALGRSIIGGEINANKTERKLYGVKYNEPLILPMFIVPDECKNSSMKVDTETTRALTKWLSSPKTYKTLRVEPYNDDIREYIGIFTDIKPYVFNGLNGLHLTFTCNSSFAYIPHQHNFTLNGQKDIFIYNDTDETEDFIYPVLTFYNIGWGNLKIKNTTYQSAMTMQIPKQFDELCVDCKNNRIIGDGQKISLFDLGYTKDNFTANGLFTFDWFKLQSGENKINFLFLNADGETNDIKVKVEYKTIAKIGGF